MFKFIENWLEKRRLKQEHAARLEREREEKEAAEEAIRIKEWREDQKTLPFREEFGFDPDLLREDRYKKEVLVKLALLAIKLKKRADELKSYNHDFSAQQYQEASTEYSELLQIIEQHDAEFGSQIPHWTELPGFLEEWQQGKRFRPTPRPTDVRTGRRLLKK